LHATNKFSNFPHNSAHAATTRQQRIRNTCWVRLVTPSVKGTIADTDQFLRDTNQFLHNTNHTITSLFAPARPNPLKTNELVNELVRRRPVPPRMPHWLPVDPDPKSQKNFFFDFVSHRLWLTPTVRMPLIRVYLRCTVGSPWGGGVDEAAR
jgi:hypothetical protein